MLRSYVLKIQLEAEDSNALTAHSVLCHHNDGQYEDVVTVFLLCVQVSDKGF